MTTLFEAAYGDSAGYSQIVVGHFENGKLVPDQVQAFEWPRQRDEIEQFVTANKDFDVYFSTCLLSGENNRERSVHTATVTNVVYVDADVCAPDNFRVEPSIIVTTSPGNYQVYWLLDDPIPATEAAEIAHRICVAHKDQGCDQSGWITAKLMRVPGTTHGKTDTEYTVEEKNTSLVYSVSDISEPYADIVIEAEVNPSDRPLPAKLPLVVDVVARLDEGAYDLQQREPLETDDWSVLSWRLAMDMFRAGFAAEEVFVAVKATRFNKYARDNRPDTDLWHEILKAEATADAELMGPPEPVDDVIPQAKAPQVRKPIKFVSDEERASIQPCFVDDFEAWVESRSPLAAHKYSRFLSFFVLANVYGDWAYIYPQHGKMALNIWGLMLGPSSVTKKSTVVRLAQTVVKAWEKRLPEDKRGVDIGSDFTAEGLNAHLAERDGRVSFIHRDEISGFFREAFTKNYMAGTVERLTALYDGDVLKTMRANTNASQQKEAKTILNLLGIGIEKHTAEVLTAHQFQSGYLPRHIWCVADAPEWTPEQEHVGQGDPDTITKNAGEDVWVTEACNQFARARKRWGKPGLEPILMTQEALERFNRFTLESKEVVSGMDAEELLEPSRTRMFWSIWKVAALLAIHDRADYIEIRHLLYVLREAETWFEDLIRMTAGVAASDFEGKVNMVEEYIGSYKNPVAPSRLYRKFASFRKGEMDEYITALIVQGRVIRVEGAFAINEGSTT